MSNLSTLSRSIEGKVAIVTGAASGMGRATAHLFVDQGAKVTIVDINSEALKTVSGEIRDAGGEVLAAGSPRASPMNIKRSSRKDAQPLGVMECQRKSRK